MLTLWRPHNDLFRLNREIDAMFRPQRWQSSPASISPAVDIQEDEDGFVLTADLPGMNEDEISLEVHDGVLSLSGKREETQEEKANGHSLRERRHGEFRRSFKLGRQIDAERIEASYSKGVLTVKLPKSELAKPRQIEVTVN